MSALPQARQSWHSSEPREAVERTRTDAARGLAKEEARRRLAVEGPNALPEPPRKSILAVMLHQLKSPFIYLLLGAAGLALALGHLGDAAVIAVVVALNTVIGAVQEGRAERSLAALRQMATRSARVIRDGEELLVAAREVVPGDILVLTAGDAVVADARILDGAALQVSEAVLTGESVPVPKDNRTLAESTGLADRRNMLFSGTYVTAGRARAVVVATGEGTELGAVAALAERTEEPKTPLERRIAQLGRYVIAAAAVVFVLVIGIGLVRDIPLQEILLVAISQVVGMVPEGLPVAVTIALAVGVQRMARRGAVIRRLAAVETLGSTTLICSDKTGTLTRNEMTVTEAWLPSGRRILASGIGYAPDGELTEDARPVQPSGELSRLIEAAVLCNDSSVSGPHQEAPLWRPVGDPTEVALVTFGVKAGLIPLKLRGERPRRAELPFDPALKMMATQHLGPEGAVVILKGAPEAVLELCSRARMDGGEVRLDAALRGRLQQVTNEMGERALRVLAVAEVPGGDIDGALGFSAFLGRAVFLGFIAQLDPPRVEVAEAVARCRAAGIRPVIVTGDHKATGLAVARTLGISTDGDAAVDGSELAAMSDEELSRRLDGISVFARVHPAQKLRIVEAYQRGRHVVAMTGDGVNDAPALARADVGVAMGLTGTEVAKEASKVVITDDNFATIVAAVEEGRVVYANLKKVILYLFSTSVAAVLVLLLALLLGYPPPLAAVQILWINLVTEGTVTVNLIMEPREGDEMQRRPVSASEPLLNRVLLRRMAFMTPAIAVSTLGWFVYRNASGVPFIQVQTETFTTLAVCAWFNVLNCRSEWRSAFDRGLLKNRWLLGGLLLGNVLQGAVIFLPLMNRLFHTTPFSLREVVSIGLVSSLVLWVEELRKWLVRRRLRRPGSEERPPAGRRLTAAYS